ncbi:iron-siderophore ABC transporter substrate-binding protein [Microbacterium sp. NPDC077663]|uniref:iron-siderophore ABC transporter substrate-binding protein n=1 Tax=Microbacterium sp. NPDC077663 TaxID=3364189 RepID=UPI0037CA6281
MTRRPARPLLGAAMLLPLLLITACGTTQTGDDAATPSAAASADCADDTTATSTGPVSLTDAFDRTVELDAPAERIAVLEWQQIEDALTLCVTPVAVADAEGYTTWDTAEVLPGSVTDVGTRQEPNFDAILGADPDLIIVEAYTAEDEIIGQLEEYGVPVLATKGADAADPIGQMKATFELIAQATGREERADAVLDAFDASVAEAKQAVAETELVSDSFAYFDGWIDGGNVSLRFFSSGSLIGALGEELGLKNAWTGEADPAYGLGITDIEGATAIGDAYLLHTSTNDAESDIMPELATSEVWTSIPAVAEDRIAGFPVGIWTFGGPRSAEQILDAYVAALTN